MDRDKDEGTVVEKVPLTTDPTPQVEHLDYSQVLLNFGEAVEDRDFIRQLQERLWGDLLGRPTRYLQFPGSQPVSFTRRHLDVLEREDYYVCEKSDGVRYLLYYTSPYQEPTAFLVDRNFECRQIPGLALPGRVEGSIHEDTLLDGELICEPGDSDSTDDLKFIFLIFDALLINGRNVMTESLPTRLKYIQNDVIAPSNASTTNISPFKLEMKKMWKPYAIAEILEIEIPKLKHGNDGLIFTPVRDPYMAGTCERLLKWKPSELNTVDFKLHINNSTGEYELHVCSNKDTHRFFAKHTPDPLLDTLDGAIIECRLDPKTRGWQYIRVRADKLNANNERVVEKILASIKDNVTATELFNRIPAIRRAWKAREAAQPAQGDGNLQKRPRV